MQNNKPDNGDINEAVEESFPASDPPSFSTPHAEYQAASTKNRKGGISPGTWVMVAIAALLLIALISLAF